MKARIKEYLESRPGPVTARELVEQVFKLRNASDDLCQELVSRELAGDPRFVREEDGRWFLRSDQAGPAEAPLSSSPFLLLLPLASAPPTTMAFLGAARLAGETLLEKLYYYAEGCGPQDEPVRSEVAEQDLERISRSAAGATLVMFDPRRELPLVNRSLISRGLTPIEGETISLKRLAKSLFPERKSRDLEEIARSFGIGMAEVTEPEKRLQIAIEVWREALATAAELGIENLAALKSLEQAGARAVDFKGFAFDRELIAALPEKPGVYLMLDRTDRPIYVGKAKNLRSRVSSYFYRRGESVEKQEKLLGALYSIEYQVVGSELEALLLEAELIKSLAPWLNRQTEVHPRQASFARDKRLILLLPSSDERRLELFLLAAGRLDRFSLRRDMKNIGAAARKIRSFFARPSKEQEHDWRAELAASWIERNRDNVNWIDLDRLGEIADCLELLRRYARMGVEEARVVFT